MNSGLKWTLLILWIVSAACFGICFADNGAQLPPPFHRLQPQTEQSNGKYGTLSLRRWIIGDKAFREDVSQALTEAQQGLDDAQKEMEEDSIFEEIGNEAEKFARDTQRKAIAVSKAAIQKSLDELDGDTVE